MSESLGKTKYHVTMQRSDGQIVEADYTVGWDRLKVSPEFVAMSCAAEHTVASGKVKAGDGYEWLHPHAGITATVEGEAVAA